MKLFKKMFVIMLFSMMCSAASAEVLLIERNQQQHNQSFPKHGQSMQQVENQYGQPLVRHESVGQPPITRWEYADFVVYFEHNLVLNSVFKRTSNNLIETP